MDKNFFTCSMTTTSLNVSYYFVNNNNRYFRPYLNALSRITNIKIIKYSYFYNNRTAYMNRTAYYII